MYHEISIYVDVTIEQSSKYRKSIGVRECDRLKEKGVQERSEIRKV